MKDQFLMQKKGSPIWGHWWQINIFMPIQHPIVPSLVDKIQKIENFVNPNREDVHTDPIFLEHNL